MFDLGYDVVRLVMFLVFFGWLMWLAWKTINYFVFGGIEDDVEGAVLKSHGKQWLLFVAVSAILGISMSFLVPSVPKISQRSKAPAVTAIDKAPDKLVPDKQRTLSDADREKLNQEKYNKNLQHVPTGQ